MDSADAASVGRYLSPRLCRRQTIRHAEAMLLTTNGYFITSKQVPKRNRSTRAGREAVRREKVRIRIRSTRIGNSTAATRLRSQRQHRL